MGALLEDMLAWLRAQGWLVAVHNDYLVVGVFGTFWLFTHPSGVWVRGEGPTDCDAVQKVVVQVEQKYPGRIGA